MAAMTGKGAKPIPNYLRPSTGSCHDACKHGGHHEFEEKGAAKAKRPKPRRQPSAPDEESKRRLVKARSVSRRRVGDFSKPFAKDVTEADLLPVGESETTVEWKDIVAYDAVPVPDDGKKRDVIKGQTESLDMKRQTESLNKKLARTVRSTLTGKTSTNPHQAAKGATKTTPPSDKSLTGKSTKPPKAKKTPALPVDKKVAESSRPIPAHPRAKSMSISSRSVRFPFTRQPSKKNSDTFKLRSKSGKAPILPSEEEKPTRLRFRKGRGAGKESSTTGVQLRIRSLRRRGSGSGVSGGGAASTGFVVPEVTLRHQKTLEKKKSRRLYNNLIEETATKLAKNKKSRVKSLVGAFETLISKIGK